MARQALLIAPDQEQQEAKARLQRSRRKQEIERFITYHPLAQMYRNYHWMLWAREDRDWIRVAHNAHFFCSGYANLTSDDQAYFAETLPNPPDVFGDWSTHAWIGYLCALIAVGERRERLREAIHHRIVDSRGADFLPPIRRTVPASHAAEQPLQTEG